MTILARRRSTTGRDSLHRHLRIDGVGGTLAAPAVCRVGTERAPSFLQATRARRSRWSLEARAGMAGPRMGPGRELPTRRLAHEAPGRDGQDSGRASMRIGAGGRRVAAARPAAPSVGRLWTSRVRSGTPWSLRRRARTRARSRSRARMLESEKGQAECRTPTLLCFERGLRSLTKSGSVGSSSGLEVKDCSSLWS